jgi:hypothetical protein
VKRCLLDQGTRGAERPVKTAEVELSTDIESIGDGVVVWEGGWHCHGFAAVRRDVGLENHAHGAWACHPMCEHQFTLRTSMAVIAAVGLVLAWVRSEG